MNENEGDAIQAYGGNKSTGLRVQKALREIEILCVDMRNTLFDQPLRKNAVGRKRTLDGDPTGEGAKEDGDGAQSDDALEDYDWEIDSDIECDVEQPRTEHGRDPVIREYQFLKAQPDAVGDRSPWPPGLQGMKPRMRVDFGAQRQVPPMHMPPPAHHVTPPPWPSETCFDTI